MSALTPAARAAVQAAADKAMTRREEEIGHLVDVQQDMAATCGRTYAAALTAQRLAESKSHVGLAEILAVALTLLAEQRTPPVDPTRDPDPELCAGPVQTPGVEGWACGRGLALPAREEQS